MTDGKIEEVQVIRGFFSRTLLTQLEAYGRSMEERKIEYTLRDSLGAGSPPDCIRAAASEAQHALGRAFNLAILKWYRIGGELSAAYEMHVDPPSRITQPFVLATILGEADFSYLPSSGEEITVRCEENTVLLMLNPTLAHRVSPPLGLSGERLFLFLGIDTDLGVATS